MSTVLPEAARAAFAVVREFHELKGEQSAVAAALATLGLAIEEAVTMREAFFGLVEDELAIMRPVVTAATVWFHAPDEGIDRLAADMGVVAALEAGGFIPKLTPEETAGKP